MTHWEAVYVPEAGFPITRGWYRQDDFPENEILYSDDLNPTTYVRWLHERGVRYVLVPDDRLDYSSKREAAVATKLHFVTRCGDVSIYAGAAPGADRAGRGHPADDARERDATRAARRALPARDPRTRDVRRAGRRHVHPRLLVGLEQRGEGKASRGAGRSALTCST